MPVLPLYFECGENIICLYSFMSMDQEERTQGALSTLTPDLLLFFSCSVMSKSLQHNGLQHTRLPCPSPTPGVLPSIFPSIRVFSNESALCIRWPKYWSFIFSISPSNKYSELTSLISLQSKGLSRVFSNTTVQKHQFFGAQLSLWSNSHIHT